MKLITGFFVSNHFSGKSTMHECSRLVYEKKYKVHVQLMFEQCNWLKLTFEDTCDRICDMRVSILFRSSR